MYRIHWREARRGGGKTIRWADVAGDVRGEILALTRRALGGEIRLSFLTATAPPTPAVASNRAAVAAWAPDDEPMPKPVEGDWSRSLTRGDPRSAFYRGVQQLLRTAEADGLLDLGQAAGIAEAISLALDGEGPFPVGELAG